MYVYRTQPKLNYLLTCNLAQVKDKEAELKSAEQKLHDEFERLRRQNAVSYTHLTLPTIYSV